MFINPQIAIENEWITHPECNTIEDWKERKFISPNAIDFTLDRLYSINYKNMFVISELGKQMRGGQEILPVPDKSSGMLFWVIDSQSVYDGLSDMYVKIPDGVCVELIVRSTLSRNGIFITSGIFDSKYEGHVGCALHNRLGISKIGQGTRIGQIKFIESDNAYGYSGNYNHSKGTHWTN